FHDEEWGVPVHDDREIFTNFDLIAVSNINEKKLVASGSIARSLLSEQKLRAVLENARQIVKIADEFGSFSQYCWGFLNHKPIVSKIRYPRQVPVKSPKADMMSKDMVRRGLRGVGPTVIYSFMQAAGLTNDHLVSCFRFKECKPSPTLGTSDANRVKTEAERKTEEPRTKAHGEEMTVNSDPSMAIDTLTIS
uniref:Uncharacterized protein n=1 Tax=Aegilops tauschii subsp. strangulata TaxID=200361 RepID=A0A453T4Z1_AEGTS